MAEDQSEGQKKPESRTEVAGVSLTPSEKRDIAWLASVNEESVSNLLRRMTVEQAVKEAARKREMLAA